MISIKENAIAIVLLTAASVFYAAGLQAYSLFFLLLFVLVLVNYIVFYSNTPKPVFIVGFAREKDPEKRRRRVSDYLKELGRKGRAEIAARTLPICTPEDEANAAMVAKLKRYFGFSETRLARLSSPLTEPQSKNKIGMQRRNCGSMRSPN